MEHLSSVMEQQHQEQVQELCSKGHSQREISQVLQVGLATVNRDISYLTNQCPPLPLFIRLYDLARSALIIPTATDFLVGITMSRIGDTTETTNQTIVIIPVYSTIPIVATNANPHIASQHTILFIITYHYSRPLLCI